MPSQTAEFDNLPLGDFLRETRNQKGLDLAAIAEETRISTKNLQAIEEGDFGALPAEAFARGFYTLYAQTLSLEPADILKKYGQERPKPAKPGNRTTAPGKLPQDVGIMAQRPSSLPFSSLGLILILLLLFGAFLCWYFSWNPATYLSQKLRSFQDEPQGFEQVSTFPITPEKTDPLVEITRFWNQRTIGPALFDLPRTATASVVEHKIAAPPTPPATEDNKYAVTTISHEPAAHNLVKDDHLGNTFSYMNGSSTPWSAGEKLSISLPVTPRNSLTQNNILSDSVETDRDFITRISPVYSLQQ